MALRGIDEAGAKELALTDNQVKKWLAGQVVIKTIYVQNRLINLLV